MPFLYSLTVYVEGKELFLLVTCKIVAASISRAIITGPGNDVGVENHPNSCKAREYLAPQLYAGGVMA